MISSRLLKLTQTNLFPIRRYLSLLEYQSRNILMGKGIDIPNFCVVDHKTGLIPFEKFEAKHYVVKAQIPAGGRKKGHFENGFEGGVHLTDERTKVEQIVDKMLGYNLITNQTGPQGFSVNKIMISEAVVDVAKEAYFSIVIDPIYNHPMVVVSSKGGVDVERISIDSPNYMEKIPVDIYEGITREKAYEISNFLGFRNENINNIIQLLMKLWSIFIDKDATQLEINPLVETKTNKIICLDCKINIDNNAKFRQKDLFDKQDLFISDRLELEATKNNLNYVSLNGNIGCMVNGAGLGMATVDLIKLLGGSAANFLDIGGAVTINQVTEALNILSSNPNVKVIYLNVFGGIVSCKIIAHGIVNARERNVLRIPIVARLEGTQIVEAKKILKNCDLDIIYVRSMEEGGRIVVQISKK